MQQLKAAGKIDENERREMVRQLLDRRAYAQAYHVWSGADPAADVAESAGIHDGGFEASLSTTESGFGWRIPETRSVSFSVDPNEPHSGDRSLRIDFGGESPNSALTSQLVVVKPSTRYRIYFAGRSREIVTGARPLVAVTDTREGGGELAQSAPLDKGTTGWLPFSIEFATTAATQAVSVTVTRERCPSSPCPIFGSISLDSFSIEQVK